MTRVRTLAAASLGVALLAGVISGWSIGRWRDWERGLEDQLLVLRGQARPPAQVVLVPIDDASLQQGDWYQSQVQGESPAWAVGTGTLPWPRAAYGLLASRLIEAGARVVAINVVFAGPSARAPPTIGSWRRCCAAIRAVWLWRPKCWSPRMRARAPPA